MECPTRQAGCGTWRSAKTLMISDAASIAVEFIQYPNCDLTRRYLHAGARPIHSRNFKKFRRSTMAQTIKQAADTILAYTVGRAV